MAQYIGSDGKHLLDILYRINQAEDIVSFGKTVLFFIRTYRNFSSGMFFSLKALNNDVIIDTAIFDTANRLQDSTNSSMADTTTISCSRP